MAVGASALPRLSPALAPCFDAQAPSLPRTAHPEPFMSGTSSPAAIEAALLAVLAKRAESASICPSEVARALYPNDEAAWRAAMPQVREVAAAMARSGRLRISRHGVTLSPDDLDGGPIRLHRGDAR